MPDHDRLYEQARYYDLAFGFRDVPAEMDLLLALHLEIRGREAESFLELAAGPARHAREAAHRGLRAVAVDLSAGMRRYAEEEAARERVYLDYRLGDLRDFSLTAPCDLAALLMDSASYLLDNAAVLHHLRATAAALGPGGVYVVELAHPRDVYRTGASCATSWKTARDGAEVDFSWGQPDDPFDPTTGITDVTVRLQYRDGSRLGEIVDRAPQRSFTANEWRALVEASGVFRTVRELGALKPDVPFDASPEAWRFVSVLQSL